MPLTVVPPNPPATIVMYHYVRDLAHTPFPRIKGLTTEAFEGQLDYIVRHYTVCSLTDVAAAIRGQTALPPDACVLTFDDGLVDHYETVFPRLLDRKITGAFFPPALPVEKHQMLDVHRLHFVLAAVTDHDEVGQELLSELEEYRETYSIAPDEHLLKEFCTAGRFDSPKVTFIKRLLQWVLPEQVRSAITRRLFRTFISGDEASFAQQVYMQIHHLRQMAASGMEIGGHGYSHIWLGKSSQEIQSEEISRTVSFLCSILGRQPSDWAMSYPYGSYNADTLQLLPEHGCTIGLTTRVGLSSLKHPFELERLDTNDLPCAATAAICPWTVAAHESGSASAIA